MPDPNENSLGQRLETFRCERNLSWPALADLMAVVEGHHWNGEVLRRIATGRGCFPRTAYRIEKFLRLIEVDCAQ